MPRLAVISCVLSVWALPLLAAEGEAKAPARLAELPMESGNLVNTALGLVLVLALIIGLAWALRRFGRLPMVGKGLISIIGGVSLGPRERAVILQVGETRLLVGVAPGRVQTLHVFGAGDGLPSKANNLDKFSGQLHAAIEERQA